jgi:hypothetical protein
LQETRDGQFFILPGTHHDRLPGEDIPTTVSSIFTQRSQFQDVHSEPGRVARMNECTYCITAVKTFTKTSDEGDMSM